MCEYDLNTNNHGLFLFVPSPQRWQIENLFLLQIFIHPFYMESKINKRIKEQ